MQYLHVISKKNPHKWSCWFEFVLFAALALNLVAILRHITWGYSRHNLQLNMEILFCAGRILGAIGILYHIKSGMILFISFLFGYMIYVLIDPASARTLKMFINGVLQGAVALWLIKECFHIFSIRKAADAVLMEKELTAAAEMQ